MSYEKMKKIFMAPSTAYRSLPFWAWNDSLCAEELVRQIHSMKEQGVGGFFMHSREGLETDYLSDEWFDLVKVCVDAAKDAGMEAWLYDEDRWPSGTAGGRVIKQGGDDSRCKGLTMEVCKIYDGHNKDVLSAYKGVVDGHHVHSFQRLSKHEPLADGEVYFLCRIEVSAPSEWFNDETPPDNLNPQSVRRFIEITHEAYKEKIGNEFGKTVKGIFTDEPGLHDTHTAFNPNRGWIPWTYAFCDYFKQQRGYDILDDAPLIFFNGEGSSAIRHDYWRTVTELYVESMSKQISEWCEDNNLVFTGHFLQENRIGLSARVGGAVMPHYVYQHTPGIDLLCEQTNEYLTVRQCTSVANQYNRPWVLTETYGCTGWGFTFEGQKWLGDWQYVMGVTRRSQHLALYSIRGCRKRDYPPVFSYNTSWWGHNHVVESYFARLSAVLCEGRPERDILILHPSTTAWAMLGTSPYGTPRRRDERDIPEIDAVGFELNRMIKHLMGMHYDFDLGDELIMENEASAWQSVLKIKDCEYKIVIIPVIKTMLRSTCDLLLEFLNNGGRLIALKPFATMIEGRPSPDLHKLFEHKNTFAAENFMEICNHLENLKCRHISIQDEYGQENTDMFYMLKTGDDFRTLFVVNHSREREHRVKIKIHAAEVEEWNALTGETYSVNFQREKGEITAIFGPAESKLYILGRVKPDMLKKPIDYSKMTVCASLGPSFIIKRDLPNALTLDRCVYRIGDGDFSEEMQLWQAQREIRETLGMRQVYYNGLAQRYKWVNIPHSSDGTKVELKFHFHIAHVPSDGISLAIESPEIFKLQLNSTNAKEQKRGEYFIDKSIGVVPLCGAEEGLNTLVVSCEYRNSYELEDCYIIGNFGVDTARQITKEPKDIRLGDWCLQGFLHYAGALTYKSSAEVKLVAGARFFIEVGEFSATALEVFVNGGAAGHIPWTCANKLEITGLVKDGLNDFELVVIGSPRNLFGPFHLKNGDPQNTNWQSFRAEGEDYTSEYNLHPYGLFGLVRIYRAAKSENVLQ